MQTFVIQLWNSCSLLYIYLQPNPYDNFVVFGECWGFPSQLGTISFQQIQGKKFGRIKEGKVFMQCTIYTTLWCIWLEKNVSAAITSDLSNGCLYVADMEGNRVISWQVCLSFLSCLDLCYGGYLILSFFLSSL